MTMSAIYRFRGTKFHNTFVVSSAAFTRSSRLTFSRPVPTINFQVESAVFILKTRLDRAFSHRIFSVQNVYLNIFIGR